MKTEYIPTPRKLRRSNQCVYLIVNEIYEYLFMGMANYYRRFVRGFSGVVAPINKLLRNDEPWTWGSEQEAAFIKIKKLLFEASILRRPDYT